MCNRYRVTTDRVELADAFDVTVVPEYDRLPDPELFPKRLAYVVRREGGERLLDIMSWGFPPPSGNRPVTNVRNLASPFWRTALSRPDRRCLVPVGEFCEWEGEKGHKVARWFRLVDRPIFAFAGLWRPFEGGGAYAFLTCEPNPLVGAVHPKAMPVILHEEDHERWMTADMADVLPLAAPYPSQLMVME
ncbi:DUF159 family protein [Sphingomonas oleivorans]|uniref:Abasic site processing protein n=1 Tax=Sphingomonas oleivorans TaxID=1735121 RepID=A0A2T5FXG4_9SPHN|nr:SOS response-associated peptidase family protein [Sphingomonas oleivorans]PTQ10827.1 DUF159 family protein [Sphingomonas oleivorans]